MEAPKMGEFDNKHSVLLIKNRMKGLGINLDQFIGQITYWWPDAPNTPVGFDFTCKNPATYTDLMKAVISNTNFGADNMLGGSQHLGASFREVGAPDSLHIILCSKRPCTIHLDSVSVAKGRTNTGQVEYDQGQVLQHLASDLFRTPLIVPSGRGGIVFGIRF
jgi:hypothetical protein